MASRGPSVSSLGTDSQDSDDLLPPGPKSSTTNMPGSKMVTATTRKGITNAKKKLRAFSIQKKTPITPVSVPKPVNTGTTTVLIGKLSSVRTTPKPEPEPDQKKLPKPPKPGASKKNLQDSYTELQKRTLADIEDMKRKMELVDLGIPLGLICPSSTSDKAMPTKAMPPIKTFLDSTKVDELIREAKRARAEGREFKFDYQKLLPDYDNPFQRKREEPSNAEKDQTMPKEDDNRNKPKPVMNLPRKSEHYDRRQSDHKKDDRGRDRLEYKDKDRSRNKEKSKDRTKDDRVKEEAKKLDPATNKQNIPKDSDLNLNDYLVCDSWSLDNDDKNTSSPNVSKIKKLASIRYEKAKQAADLVKESLKMKDGKSSESPKPVPAKIEKLKPVIDSFKFEIDPNEDDVLDMFDEVTELNKFAKPTSRRDPFDSPIDLKLFDYDQDMSKEGVIDANDDNFLESVINEIKQENMSDDSSQEKGLVEYDISPKDYEDKNDNSQYSQGSVTPELDDRMRDLQSSQHSNYMDGYRSTESGYKSTDSAFKTNESYEFTEDGYKSPEPLYKSPEPRYSSPEPYKTEAYRSTESGYKSPGSGYKSPGSGYKSKQGRKSKDGYRQEIRQDEFRLSVEKELDEALEVSKMAKSTVDSLETWSFVLKICQPLLFRHDKNKCYKETHAAPKIWFTENPKVCSCVKDRSVVYEELEMCKMGLVDRVYGCDPIPEEPFPHGRSWYPRLHACVSEAPGLQPDNEWEMEDPPGSKGYRSLTPQKTEEVFLDREYQRFMQAVWPEAVDKPGDTSRSTTPVRQETRKKKKLEDTDKDAEDKKKAKKIKLSSEGWSQESDLDEEAEKSAKVKQERKKSRKRKHSTSSESGASDDDQVAKKKKKVKKKGNKKLKAKLEKKRRLDKKLKKQLKEKQKKKKKLQGKVHEVSDDTDELKDKKKLKKAKKLKKEPKQKKVQKKKKVKVQSTSSSSSSSSSSDTESDAERKKKKQKKELQARKKKDKKKNRKQSSESSQSEDLFDVNVLKNIKTERLTDDEKITDFSPRRQKPREREIINVKELQNDFVGNNIHIKQEKLEEPAQVKEVVKESETEIKEQEKVSEKEDKVVEPIVEAEVVATKVEPTSKVELKVQEPSPVVREETPSPKTEESHDIPLPEETNAPQNLSDIALPPEIKPTNVEPPSYSYAEVPSQTELYPKETGSDCEEKFGDAYEPDNYELFEQMAMAYQSDVANQHISESATSTSGSVSRIETVVRRRGEIKCDWRAGDLPAVRHPPTPSRWGLKPGDVNIVLTAGPGESPGGGAGAGEPPEQFRIRSVLEPEPVYEIQSLANRTDSNTIGYDEAYMEAYGAADRLQYGDCFADAAQHMSSAQHAAARVQQGAARAQQGAAPARLSTLDERINRALRETVLGEVAKETDDAENDKETREKGILMTKAVTASEPVRGAKRVSFADGYKPGQDSDTEEPPVKKKKRPRRLGCAWPCPATHPDHVPLWDALPPPPPPPGSPPPPAPPGPPPLHLLRRAPAVGLLPSPRAGIKIDPNSLPPFLPPEPPPGLLTFS